MSDALLASAMRKVLLSEDMYVDDDNDRLRLDGHVHGGLSADEIEAVRAVVEERRRAEDAAFETLAPPPAATLVVEGGYRMECEQIEVTMDGTFGGLPDMYRRFVSGLRRYYRDDEEITEAEFRAALALTAEGDAR